LKSKLISILIIIFLISSVFNVSVTADSISDDIDDVLVFYWQNNERIIEKPKEHAIYFNNKELTNFKNPFKIPIIIGPIELKVRAFQKKLYIFLNMKMIVLIIVVI
jgi:hypothetical protein